MATNKTAARRRAPPSAASKPAAFATDAEALAGTTSALTLAERPKRRSTRAGARSPAVVAGLDASGPVAPRSLPQSEPAPAASDVAALTEVATPARKPRKKAEATPAAPVPQPVVDAPLAQPASRAAAARAKVAGGGKSATKSSAESATAAAPPPTGKTGTKPAQKKAHPPKAAQMPVADAPDAPRNPPPAETGDEAAAGLDKPRRAGRGRRQADRPARNDAEPALAAPISGESGPDAAQPPGRSQSGALEVAAASPGPHAAPKTREAVGPSRLGLAGDAVRRLQWQRGLGCPERILEALAPHLDLEDCIAVDGADPADSGLQPIDSLLPLLMRHAADAGHEMVVDPAVWPFLAALRDARSRCAWLQAAYPDGPASAALQQLLTVRLPAFQAEGALWAVAAGHALLADDPGLGKSVQAVAAAELWHRHFGVRRVLVLCSAAQLDAWRRTWRQLAGRDALVMSPAAHQRAQQWSSDAPLRLITPDVLQSDASLLADWGPELIIVDEPQRLALDRQTWAALHAPHALVLCGAPLDAAPELLEQLIDWLDPQRLGPLGAWQTLRAARDESRALDEDTIDRVTRQLSRVLLQRQRSDVADQLPAVILGARLTTMTDAQRQAHARAKVQAERLLAGWWRSGYLSDAEQWQLSRCLLAMQQAAHRADPTRADSALAEATVQALAGQLDDWAETDAPAEGDREPDTGGPGLSSPADVAVWLLCETPADALQLADRLGPRPAVALVPPGPLPPGLPLRVLQAGVPWRLPQAALAGQTDGQIPSTAHAGQHQVMVVAEDSIDIGLLDTLAQRIDTPRGPADPGGRGFLTGDRLTAWLKAVAAALEALPAA